MECKSWILNIVPTIEHTEIDVKFLRISATEVLSFWPKICCSSTVPDKHKRHTWSQSTNIEWLENILLFKDSAYKLDMKTRRKQNTKLFIVLVWSTLDGFDSLTTFPQSVHAKCCQSQIYNFSKWRHCCDDSERRPRHKSNATKQLHVECKQTKFIY